MNNLLINYKLYGNLPQILSLKTLKVFLRKPDKIVRHGFLHATNLNKQLKIKTHQLFDFFNLS